MERVFEMILRQVNDKVKTAGQLADEARAEVERMDAKKVTLGELTQMEDDLFKRLDEIDRMEGEMDKRMIELQEEAIEAFDKMDREWKRLERGEKLSESWDLQRRELKRVNDERNVVIHELYDCIRKMDDSFRKLFWAVRKVTEIEEEVMKGIERELNWMEEQNRLYNADLR